MASTNVSLICNKFAGIRKRDAVFSEDAISCSDCQNVELFYTGLNTGIGIRTSKGNVSISDEVFSDGEQIIGMFESNQDGHTYLLVYTEDDTDGKLYTYSVISSTLTLLKDGLSLTGKACGTDFAQGVLDMFCFSNGVDIVYLYSDTDTHSGIQVDTGSHIHLVDVEGNTVSGLGMVAFDNKLWIFNDRYLWYSKQAECRVFDFQDADKPEASSGFIILVKPITAIHEYLGSLAVFNKDSSQLIKKNTETVYEVTEESPGGCASYNALEFHGTDLYFYDDTKKGVFSFQQVVNGDKTLGQNIALSIQDELTELDVKDLYKIRTKSVVTSDRNEVWFLLPISDDNDYSITLIFDYLRGEWVKRKSQKINCIVVHNGYLYTGGENIYVEYTGNKFNGEFIESYFHCTPMNLGEDNKLKILVFPPRVTVTADNTTDFCVKYIKNYDFLKKVRTKVIKTKAIKNALYWDKGIWDVNFWAKSAVNSIYKLRSATFKTLEIHIFAEEDGQSFEIKALEFSKIKVKQV